jgi:hypothetical protein
VTSTANDVSGLAKKPGIYMILTFMILAGNTMIPISLRTILNAMHYVAEFLQLDKEGIDYALENPRLLEPRP